MRENTDPTVAAAAVLLIAITLVALIAHTLLTRRKAGETA